MNAKTRHQLLIAGFALTAALLAWDRSAPPAGEVVAARQPGTRAMPAPAAAKDGVAIATIASRADYVLTEGNAFGIPRPKPAPPAPPAPPPPPPAPPALPFRYIGKQFAEGVWEVYLAKSDRTLIARVGDVVDMQYKVVAITPPSLVLLYLPMNEKQSLQIGPSLDE